MGYHDFVVANKTKVFIPETQNYYFFKYQGGIFINIIDLYIGLCINIYQKRRIRNCRTKEKECIKQ